MGGPTENCNSSAKDMRDLLEEILQKNKVDLILAGHVHAYERLFPIYNDMVDNESLRNNKNTYVNPKYPAHIVCGCGGNKEKFEKYPINEKISKNMFNKAGICVINFEGGKMTHSWVSSDTKEVMDSFEIIKN